MARLLTLLQGFMRWLFRRPSLVTPPAWLPESWESRRIITASAETMLAKVIDQRFEREVIHIPQFANMKEEAHADS